MASLTWAVKVISLGPCCSVRSRNSLNILTYDVFTGKELLNTCFVGIVNLALLGSVLSVFHTCRSLEGEDVANSDTEANVVIHLVFSVHNLFY